MPALAFREHGAFVQRSTHFINVGLAADVPGDFPAQVGLSAPRESVIEDPARCLHQRRVAGSVVHGIAHHVDEDCEDVGPALHQLWKRESGGIVLRARVARPRTQQRRVEEDGAAERNPALGCGREGAFFAVGDEVAAEEERARVVAVVARVQTHGRRQVAHRVSSEVLSAGPLAVVV